MPKVTIADLFAKIGQLTMENEALRAENEALVNALNNMAEAPAEAVQPVEGTGKEK